MIIDDMPDLDDAYRDEDQWKAPLFVPLLNGQIAQLKRPKLRARRSGVYFLFRGQGVNSNLVYVGVSDDVSSRVKAHRAQRRMNFHFATYLPVPWPWHFAIEALYIRAYNPEYNQRLTKRTASDVF